MSDPKKYQKINIFVASPSDMATEKGLLGRVVDSLNKGLADYLGLILEVKEWGSVVPSMGRPEGVILDQLPIQEWDIFIGLMWLRFGQPSGGKDVSGKEFESGRIALGSAIEPKKADTRYLTSQCPARFRLKRAG